MARECSAALQHVQTSPECCLEFTCWLSNVFWLAWVWALPPAAVGGGLGAGAQFPTFLKLRAGGGWGRGGGGAIKKTAAFRSTCVVGGVHARVRAPSGRRMVGSTLATSVCPFRHDRMEQGPTEPHTRRGTLLLSSGGAGGGYYLVAFDTGPIASRNQFPCQTLGACLVGRCSGSSGEHAASAGVDASKRSISTCWSCRWGTLYSAEATGLRTRCGSRAGRATCGSGRLWWQRGGGGRGAEETYLWGRGPGAATPSRATPSRGAGSAPRNARRIRHIRTQTRSSPNHRGTWPQQCLRPAAVFVHPTRSARGGGGLR